MNFLTTGDLFLALNDLLGKRYTDVVRSKIGQGYLPLLKKKQAQLTSLPKSIISPTPFADQLAGHDAIHDDCVDTILQVTNGVLSSPRASASLKTAAKTIIDTLKITASDKSAPYPQEAFTAIKRKEEIAGLKGTLQQFSLPEGGTLYDIALDYVAAGEAIDQLLSERSKFEALTEEEKRTISSVRPEIIGILGRFRRSLIDEIAGDPNLGANLPELIFGYFDTLHETRVALNQAAQEAKQRAKEAAAQQATKDAQLAAAKAQLEATRLAKEAEAAQKKADEAMQKAEDRE